MNSKCLYGVTHHKAIYRQFEIEDNPKIRNRNSMGMRVEGMVLYIFTKWKGEQQHGINESDT